MGRFPQPIGDRGSLRWVQHLVNEHSTVLEAARDRSYQMVLAHATCTLRIRRPRISFRGRPESVS
jgi:hypothetical protein